MIPVLIVDDDFLVCRFLTQLIDWEGNGYELLGTAGDGARALAVIREKQPRILITDIEMPVMNGIDLVKEVRKADSGMKILILSCHDDLAHVKEGIRSGADEYFLKEELTKEKLLEILSSFSEELAETQKQELPEEVSPGKPAPAEEKHLLQLLEGTAADTGEGRPDGVLAVRIADYADRAMLSSTEQRESFYRSFCQLLLEEASAKGDVKVCHVRGGWFALLVYFPAGGARQDVQYSLLELGNRILHQTDRQFEMKAATGIAEMDGSRDIAAAWTRARNLLGFAFYERNAVFTDWQYGELKETIPKEAADFLEQAEQWKVKGETGRIREGAEEAVRAFQKEKTREAAAAAWVRSCDGIFQRPVRPAPRKFEELRTLGEEYAAQAEKQFREQYPYSDSIAEAVQYIQQNFRENITQQAAADAVHLTPAYLSFMFHKETGVTFSEYLQNCRLEEAKKLLRETGKKVREISEDAGYNDYRHFCRLFKKTTGMTPQDYRKRQ